MAPPRAILESDKQALKIQLNDMRVLVMIALDRAMQSLLNYDLDLAQQVIADDSAVNKLRHDVEDNGISAIALQQPVASDLRVLMSDIYIAMELERIADHAAAIAKIVLQLKSAPENSLIALITEMADQCKAMLENIMAAYQNADEQLAREVAVRDDDIDKAEQQFNELMFEQICNHPDKAIECTYLLWISHNLERIGDRVTNIAERIVYMATSNTPDLND